MVHKGTVLSCTDKTAVVRSEDGLQHTFLRPSDIPLHTWKRMHVVGEAITWLDAAEEPTN